MYTIQTVVYSIYCHIFNPCKCDYRPQLTNSRKPLKKSMWQMWGVSRLWLNLAHAFWILMNIGEKKENKNITNRVASWRVRWPKREQNPLLWVISVWYGSCPSAQFDWILYEDKGPALSAGSVSIQLLHQAWCKIKPPSRNSYIPAHGLGIHYFAVRHCMRETNLGEYPAGYFPFCLTLC